VPTVVNLDGRLLPPEEALVPVLDRGFLYGDSVYEVLRTYGGVPFAAERHWQRLERSAARLWLGLPPRAELELQVARTLEAAGNDESYVRIIVTRGVGTFGLAPGLSQERRLVVLVRPLATPPPEQVARGLHLAVVGLRRNDPRTLDPKLKTGNYLNSVLALGEAQRGAADDAVLLDLEGRVTECTSSNIFFAKDGVLVTPPLTLGLLEGVTRAVVIELARGAGLLVREETFFAGALAEADELFVTSTLREVLPVTRLSLLEDRDPRPRPVGSGEPGPLSLRLLQLLREHARRTCSR
jgi:branched-chain amino acid aminotransferase